MGHPWKKKQAKPKSPEQLFGKPLWDYVTSPEFVEKGRQQKRIRLMKHEFLRLQEKNRLLKRKIRDFYKQGEGNGKSEDLG
jgi:hypothetical protein